MLFRATLALALCASAAATTCDLFTKGKTPCVAAHSTIRALYGMYTGPLYQLSNGGKTMDIKVTGAGGVADGAAHEKVGCCAAAAAAAAAAVVALLLLLLLPLLQLLLRVLKPLRLLLPRLLLLLLCRRHLLLLLPFLLPG